MKEIIENLYPMNRCLLGEGYDNALEYIKHLVKLDVIEVPSGTKVGNWIVPDEWVVRDAWVKFNGEKIIDYQKQPLSLVVGSIPFHGKMNLEEFQRHLNYSDDMPDATPYEFKFYDKDWGFCVPKNQIKEHVIIDDNGDMICENGVCVPALKDIDPSIGKVQIEGVTNYKPKFKDKLVEGEYEVFIDTEYKPGIMKIGVHEIKGQSDREVLLFAHLDHPYQANDNLSAVACLLDLATKLKAEHTVKIVLCPETIGSIAYAHLADISKVDFVIAVDICGNDNSILMQKSYNEESKLNRVAHLAIQSLGKSYRKGQFRSTIGSDEYVFNDPLIGIPGIMLSRHPYKEYHTSEDTPDKINYDMIAETRDVVMKIIEIYEKDFTPKREVKGPLMRSRYAVQSKNKQLNLSYDYFWYAIDGKRSLAELCCNYGLNFDFTLELMQEMENDKSISRVDSSKEGKPTVSRKEPKRISRKANVSGKRRKVS
jgi:aminopeptidase-like protein